MSGETVVVGPRLRAEWGVVAGVAVAVAVGGAHFVGVATTPAAGRCWFAVAGGLLAYQVGFLRYHLDRNRPVDGAARVSLGPANAVTLARGMLYAAAAGFLFVPPATPALRWAPGLCYGAGAALDFVDGAVARRTGSATVLGRKLDPAFDTMGFLFVPLVGIAWGRLPAVYLAVGLARYCFRAGEAWRRVRERPLHPLPDSRVRRPLAAGQMAFIAVALPPVVPPGIVAVAATVAVVPTLATFARDWLAVSGRVGPVET